MSLSAASQVIVSIFLAAGASMALGIASKVIGVQATLRNLTGSRILILSVAAALGSGASYHMVLTLVGAQTHSIAPFLTASFGDAAGTWAVIYVLKPLFTLGGSVISSKV